jgi:hypothetical protein
MAPKTMHVLHFSAFPAMLLGCLYFGFNVRVFLTALQRVQDVSSFLYNGPFKADSKIILQTLTGPAFGQIHDSGRHWEFVRRGLHTW